MKTRLHLASALSAAALYVAFPALAADNAQEFVNKAAIAGMFEVESSKVAAGKVQDQSVKDFAQKMIDDHGAGNAKLATIAGEQKLVVPTALDAGHKADLETLNNAVDPVDAPYIQMQRDAHAEAVSLFESYAQGGDNAPLKSFATETLPTLKMHREMVEAMASGTPDGQSGPSTSTTPAVNTPDTTNPGAPVPGANSFTEDQARGRIQEAGFTDVTALTKDDQGIWRGQAVKDGKSTAVALDFQGNVVAGAN
jgi:putative membrane protein